MKFRLVQQLNRSRICGSRLIDPELLAIVYLYTGMHGVLHLQMAQELDQEHTQSHTRQFFQ